ncbi:exonuclease domain-containing protein [Bacillus sp. T33-2]|uniref:exonuclease domain-containing protein n=1 Tax=Bacillus sp. T33-2 TaxID=2054168 RepID=UPI0021550E3B|nr:exonuclease domain-containing protein [Bacillus sp. T33-2]
MIQYIRQMSGKIGSSIYAGVQGQTNPQHISFLRQLQNELKAANGLESPLDELEVVVFDLETTGFFPDKGDYVISIGAVKMVGDKPIADDTFYSLLKSEKPLDERISSLTNIGDEDLRSAPDASDVLIQFLNFIKSSILVAHHAKHEQSFMQKMTWDLMRSRFEHRIIDTSFLIRLEHPQASSLTLDQACLQCDIEIKDRHHALGDAKMTAQLWGYYINKAKHMGFRNLGEIYEYLAKLR